MRLKNILFVVRDMERSKQFYEELFGLFVTADFGTNVIMSEGLVLQQRKQWEKALSSEVSFGGGDAQLYFEEPDMDGFLKKLQASSLTVKSLEGMAEDGRGRKVIRLYDPDYHLIEVAEPLDAAAGRLLKSGMTAEVVAEKTGIVLAQQEDEGKQTEGKSGCEKEDRSAADDRGAAVQKKKEETVATKLHREKKLKK